MTDNLTGIDLDAARRESQYPDGIPVHLGGERFVLPAELPVETFDPLLDDSLGLLDLLRTVMAKENEDTDVAEIVLGAVAGRPAMLRHFLQAVKDCFRILFGDDQYERFTAHRPSVNDYLRLTQGLLRLYGTTLGEAFASPGSSEGDGATQKPTSPSTTDSTPETPGDAQETPAS